MGDPGRAQGAWRIERGRATKEELAALTVVLLALQEDAARQREGYPLSGLPPRGSCQWSRPAAYRAPRSWQ